MDVVEELDIYVKQTLKGLIYFHELGYKHDNLHIRNVLFVKRSNCSERVVLNDFKLSNKHKNNEDKKMFIESIIDSLNKFSMYVYDKLAKTFYV